MEFYFIDAHLKCSLRFLLWVLTLIGSATMALQLCAQSNGPAPHNSAVLFENADEVVIYTKDSTDIALRNIAQALRAKGFVIDTIIPSLIHAQVTKVPSIYGSTEASDASVTAYLRTRGSETLIFLQGYTVKQSKLTTTRKVSMECTQYHGPRRGYLKASFRQLEAVALSYPNGRVVYQVGMWENRLR
ncbi:hypothetical protein [Hymenobacter sp. PAMC 26628]|uniref:hypothetical protein n=1 Tax=Hymenobacter sp. PAMC 26628 TaxID=1484118 RepID=UPI000B06F90A|nr:hypothetical protein [Hymenobacter sp. PAMC 26628]